MMKSRKGAIHSIAFVMLGAGLVAAPACSGKDSPGGSGDGDRDEGASPGGSPGEELDWPEREELNLGGAPNSTKPFIWTPDQVDTTTARPRGLETFEPTLFTCTPGEYSCECTQNFTCQEGMDCTCNDAECTSTVCGDVNRWGPWDKSYEWPAPQAVLWGSGSDDDMAPPPTEEFGNEARSTIRESFA